MSATNSVHVDPSNAEQLRAWDGEEGAYWADKAEYFERALAAYHDPFFAAAAVGVADRILDVGCGTGLTTRDAARSATSGSALGVDLSSRMIEHARSRAVAEGIGNVSYEQVDAQIHPFEPRTFDVAISQTGAMFFGDLTAAFVNVGRALKPGGRLVLLSWQPPANNAWVRELTGALAAGRDLPAPPPDAPGPFSLDDPERVRRSSKPRGSARSSIRASRRTCGSGTTLTTPTGSCSGCSAGCWTGSTTPAERARSTGSGRPSRPMRPAGA